MPLIRRSAVTHKAKTLGDLTPQQVDLVRTYLWGAPLEPSTEAVTDFFRLLKYVASADGVFSDKEKGAFILDASLSSASSQLIQQILDEDQSNFDAKSVYTRLQSSFPDLGKWIVYASYLVAGADGLGEQEIAAVTEIANAFKVSDQDNHSLRFSLEVYYKGKEMSNYYLNMIPAFNA
jgi:tellurite resistance protein